MSIGAIASGIWHSVSSALATPRPQSAGFTPDKPASGSPTPPGEAGTPDSATRKTLADLQAWITARPQANPAPDLARVRNAYAATSAAGPAG